MAIKRPKPEEIVVKLRQVEVLMGHPRGLQIKRPPTDFEAASKTIYFGMKSFAANHAKQN